MGSIFRFLLPKQILYPILRPLTRFLVGMVAVPLFRMFLRRVIRLQELDQELEKDFEEWFRASLLLLVATANMEHVLFGWVPLDLDHEHAWIAVGFRLLLAIGVIESMPDQDLFSVIHPGPPKLKWTKGRVLQTLREQLWPIGKGILCRHLNRSSPVFAIMAAIFGGNRNDPEHPELFTHFVVGWTCYGLAITQYLIIALVTSRDKAIDVLSEFDRKVAVRRKELIEEFEIAKPAQVAVNPGAQEAADPQCRMTKSE